MKKNSKRFTFLLILFWTLVAIWAYYFLDFKTQFETLKNNISIINLYVTKIITVALLYLFFKFSYNIIFNRIILNFLTGISKDDESAYTIKKFFGFFWWFLFLIVLIPILFGGYTQFATSIGLIGLALSLIFQRPILNILGWLAIVTQGLFKEGDRVEIMPIRGKPIRGDVSDINIFHTKLTGLIGESESPSNKDELFPNEFILYSQIRNYSGESNYIRDEIEIKLTLNSDYKEAMKILKTAMEKIIVRQKNYYIKKIKKQQEEIDFSLNKLIKSSKRVKKEEKKEEIKTEKKELQTEAEKLDSELKRIQELESELKPRINISIKDSTINLIGQYMIPYTMVKPSRTKIFRMFLDDIKEKENIKIAEFMLKEN